MYSRRWAVFLPPRFRDSHLPQINIPVRHAFGDLDYNSKEGATALPKFEECLERLEKIVQELEKGEVPLEKSLTLFEEGIELSSTCRKELDQAEGKVEILLKQNGKLQTEPLEPVSEVPPTRK